ncbi:MAG TPA: hypothetical protein VNF29_16240 [Candidatus Binataceae bacterium]|nr:hypothetical protein [Candidatus Binataceae bacterium]
MSKAVDNQFVAACDETIALLKKWTDATQRALIAARGIRALRLPEPVALVCADDMRKIYAALNVGDGAANMAKFAAKMEQDEKTLRQTARAARG